RYGEARARVLFALSLDAIAFLEALVSSEGIDADYRRSGHLEAAFKPSHFEGFRREQELLDRVFVHRVSLVSRADQRRELGSYFYHGLLVDERSGALHPGRYARGLAAAAAKADAGLWPHTPVTAIRRSTGGGGRFEVDSARGRVSAAEVLVATN